MTQRFSIAYQSRREAGRALAQQLLPYRRSGAAVLALSPASVPIADEVAAELELPLDVFLIHPVPVPGEEELAMGWVTRAGQLTDRSAAERAGVSEESCSETAMREASELDRREQYLRDGRSAVPFASRTAILVTEGLTEGAAFPPVADMLRRAGAAKVVVATPVALPASAQAARAAADDVVIGRELDDTGKLEAWYDDAEEIGDEHVRLMLHHAAQRYASAAVAVSRSP